MRERSGEVGDGLIDLNKEPFDRKRKRIERNSADNGNVGSDGSPKSGRVLRSRTVAMSDGEKKEIKMEIVELEDMDENEIPVFESKGETEPPVFQETGMTMRKRGRPPIGGGKCKVTLLSNRKKGRRGRPRKREVECGVPSWSNKKRGRGRPPKFGIKCEVPSLGNQKKRRGRPPKSDVYCEVLSLGNQMRGRGRPPKSEVYRSVPPLGNGKRGRGRPPKLKVEVSSSSIHKEVKCEVISSSNMEEVKCEETSNQKRRRGRPLKSEGKCGVPSVSYRQENDKVMQQKVEVSSNGADQGQERPEVKRNRGRRPKVDAEKLGLVIGKNDAQRIKDHKQSGYGDSDKRVKVEASDLGNAVMKPEQATETCARGKDAGLREQKQLLRDQIVAMIKKAGWTVEYRQRQGRDYQDAVYVDRDGKTHWSVTLAYRMLKQKIDDGNADDRDVSAFTPIPEGTFSMLYRMGGRGKNTDQRKKGAGKRIRKNSKSRPSDGRGGKRRTLLARRPRDGSDGDNYKLYEGKRTLLSWMIDLGTIPLGGKVKYKNGKDEMVSLEGKILKEGICCDCCNIVHAVRDFESHAKSTLGKPYQNMYLDSGNSLSQCLLDSWTKHVELDKIGFVCVDVDGNDPHDDTCAVCGDGGDLICCESCPSTFHNGCLHIEVPSGDWHCVYCSCKYCGKERESTSTTSDDCSVLSELFPCRLCEEKFHIDCIEGTFANDFDNEGVFFCGEECSKIFEQLQVLLGVRHELEEGFSFTILQHHAVTGDASIDADSLQVEINSKLAAAFNIMDECFQPIIDERSGINMIHNVVYNSGSNIKRLNYDGFYTVILEKGDELVAAASIRIHGAPLAEMPFIGTRFRVRRQGMCRRLLNGIEMVLGSLGVKKLVIPAISALSETWTKVFGFAPLEESKSLEMKYMSLVVFPGIAMLQKSLIKMDSEVVGGQHHTATQSHIECTELDSSSDKCEDASAAASAETPVPPDGS